MVELGNDVRRITEIKATIRLSIKLMLLRSRAFAQPAVSIIMGLIGNHGEIRFKPKKISRSKKSD